MPNKVKYVDGFVLIVKKSRIEAYRKMAEEGKRLWKKYGALDYKECVADDMRIKGITLTFPKLAKTKPGEVVVFSYIGYRSKAHRDSVNKKVMSDPSMKPGSWDEKSMPFDMKRMSVGGFKVLVSG